MTLREIYNKYKVGDWPDKNSIHSYLPVYEEIFEPYRYIAKNILEIGLMSGESLRMWTDYFEGNVYGMDCSEMPVNGLADLRPIIAEGRHNVIIGDATNGNDIEKYFKDIKFDVVIDDGNHQIESQLKSYNILKNKMAENSIYIIEDIQEIDKHKWLFQSISDANVEILDRRHIKNRYDDCLIILRN